MYTVDLPSLCCLVCFPQATTLARPSGCVLANDSATQGTLHQARQKKAQGEPTRHSCNLAPSLWLEAPISSNELLNTPLQVWQDGELRQKATGEARLLNDQGDVVSSCKAPKSSLEPFAEGMRTQSCSCNCSACMSCKPDGTGLHA